MDGFYDHVRRGWFRALRRRSQRHLTWDRFNQWLDRFPLPRARIFPSGELWLDDADNPREEPSAGKPHARICGGEAEWPSYPTIPPSPSSSNATTSAGASKSSRIARHSKRASNTSYAMPLSANVCPRNRVRYMSRRRKPNSRRPNQRQGLEPTKLDAHVLVTWSPAVVAML